MESLFNYGSDDENNQVSSEVNLKPVALEQDVNYDNITMEMSEDSSTSTSSDRQTSRFGFLESSSSNQEIQRKDEACIQKEGREKKQSRSRSNERTRSRERSERKRSSRDHHCDKDGGRERDDRNRYRSSRSPQYKHDRPRRSRSPTERAKYVRREHSPPKRFRERSPRRSCYERKPSKLSILEKLGIELKIPDTSEKDGSVLPSYYNPVAMNPVKYAEQVTKRKLLWSNANKQGKCANDGESLSTDSKGKLWQGATFSQDQDGKMTAKFQRLMGIKQPQGESSVGTVDQGSTKEIIKKQEELFSSMELQYEVARAATHTQRGVGLGFGSHHYPR